MGRGRDWRTVTVGGRHTATKKKRETAFAAGDGERKHGTTCQKGTQMLFWGGDILIIQQTASS